MVSRLFFVFREENGIFFEDVNEDIVKEGFHFFVCLCVRKTCVFRQSEIIGQGLDFLDDVACSGVFVFQGFYVRNGCLVRWHISPHEGEDKAFFLGKVFFQFGLEVGVETVQLCQEFTVMRIMDDEDLVEELFY